MSIWPWSTIRKLREALAYEKREVALWVEAYTRALSQAEDARERVSEAVSKNTSLQGDWETLKNENFALRALRAQLTEATKNDTRDPKTGRFVKGSR